MYNKIVSRATGTFHSRRPILISGRSPHLHNADKRNRVYELMGPIVTDQTISKPSERLDVATGRRLVALVGNKETLDGPSSICASKY